MFGKEKDIIYPTIDYSVLHASPRTSTQLQQFDTITSELWKKLHALEYVVFLTSS